MNLKILASILATCVAASAAELPIKAATVIPLSPSERKVLSEAILPDASAAITIVCGGEWCKFAAADVADVFKSKKWAVQRIDHPGLGIDGVVGLRLVACNIGTGTIENALRQMDNRKIEVIHETQCFGGPSIALVIGRPD